MGRRGGGREGGGPGNRGAGGRAIRLDKQQEPGVTKGENAASTQGTIVQHVNVVNGNSCICSPWCLRGRAS